MKPRIIHVYKDYWPPILGGVERSINWMATGLLDQFDITVLVNSRTRHTRERTCDGVRVIEVAELGRAFSAPLAPTFPLWLRRLQADIWHFHIPNPTGDVSYLAARPRGAVVATYHSDIVRQKWAMSVYGPLLDAFLRRCTFIFPTSPHLIPSSPFLSRFTDRCRPLPLGMPLGRFHRTPEAAAAAREIRQRYHGMPLVSFVGKLRYYKGLHFLISALRSLPHVHALIMGEGTEGPKLQRLAAELQVADRVHFLGEIPDDEVVHHLFASEVFVLPSHLPSEAYGLSQVEAMACGLPVVCTNLPTGVPFVNQHGETGLVVPPADDTALAAAIMELLDDPSRRTRMGEAALRRAQQEFSQEAMCRRLAALYREAMGPKYGG